MAFFSSNFFELMIALTWLAMVGAMVSWARNNNLADLAYRASHTEFLVAAIPCALGIAVYYAALVFDPDVTVDFRTAIIRPCAFFFGLFMCLFFMNGHLYRFIRWLRRKIK